MSIDEFHFYNTLADPSLLYIHLYLLVHPFPGILLVYGVLLPLLLHPLRPNWYQTRSTSDSLRDHASEGAC